MPTPSLSLSQLLPNSVTTMHGTAFLFGAGTSFEAGYPLMSTLTRDVLAALSTADRDVLDEVLGAAGASYDSTTCTPNIETIADLVIAHGINSAAPRFISLEGTIRDLVVARILDVKSPSMETHVRFIESLKKRTFGATTTIWILTTNYDTLFETAAAYAGVAIETGFVGATHRFFSPSQFTMRSGTATGSRFSESRCLTIRLLKLHGSVSWIADRGSFYECHPAAINPTMSRVMVLPRRRKVMDSLSPPFNSLFGVASRVLGNECKYVVSCGFGYGDDHVNDQLLQAPLSSNLLRLFVLAKEEPDGIARFAGLPTVSAAFETSGITDGRRTSSASGLWRFSTFASLF